ncbi:hypothetical protein ACRRRU_09530 [Dickeya fangzhongdai]|nr:hypothetical protein [Dickeya fangzhongdai]WES88407.1 hypothetical protein PQ617_19650 [Dickeya fangzhongdai]
MEKRIMAGESTGYSADSAIKWDDGADALLNQRNDADTAQGGVLLTANAG